MPILNYTTTVPVDRTVAAVQKLLVGAGARQIMSEYDRDGRLSGITFALETATGMRAAFNLPVHVDRVFAVLERDRSVPPRYRTPEHAERVAWRIVKDWLEAQLAIVATEMVTFDQVMLAYVRTSDGTTLYDLYRGGGLPALGAG